MSVEMDKCVIGLCLDLQCLSLCASLLVDELHHPKSVLEKRHCSPINKSSSFDSQFILLLSFLLFLLSIDVPLG